MNKNKHYVWNYWFLTTTLVICSLSSLLATGNCDNLSFNTSNNQISISGLTTSSKVEIIGQNTNWEVITICDGDCLSSTTIPNLTIGEYSVKVNLIDSQGNCYREEKISLEEEVEGMNSDCQFEISAEGTDARILCFEVDNNGITTLNIVENGAIYQKQLDKNGAIISNEMIGSLVSDSTLIRNNQIIKKLADGTIAFSKAIPAAVMEQIPNIESVTQLTDGSFVLAGFQKIFNPEFGFETNDSLLIVVTDANLAIEHTAIETQNGGPNVIKLDRVIQLIPRADNEFIIYYSRGRQGPVLIDSFKNFTKYKKAENKLERIKDFNTFGSFFNRINISPCEDFLIADDRLEVVTQRGAISAKGFTRFDLNSLDRIEGRSVGTRSVDFGGATNFYSYSYKEDPADEFSTLSVSFLEDPITNQSDSTKMEIRFLNNSDVPSHRKVIPSIEFDRVIRTGDTACLVLFKKNNGLYAFNPDCQIIEPTTTCQMLQFTSSNNQITIDGLTTGYNKVEIIGKNTDWQIIPICDGDCPPTLSIPDLASGEYTVKVNQSEDGGNYCYREDKVIVSNNSNDTADCDNIDFVTENDQIIIESLTANYDKVEIIGRNTDWQVITVCDGDCADTQIIPNLDAGAYTIKVNQGGTDGSFCYREEVIIVENGSGSRNRALDFGDNLVLYPNPARDRVNIELPSIDSQKGTIHIFNVFGQCISTTSINELNKNILTIDLNGFENGIYVMTIQIDGLAKFSRRFVVEHLK